MFETHEECLVCLEEIRWDGTPTCPYCGSVKATKYKKKHRYRCNSCFTSYSVTVGTLFHKTHVDLRKWFRAILLLRKLNPDISIRKLAQEIQVNRATASQMVNRIVTASPEQAEILRKIVREIEKRS
ncbi:IS1595 family transposase [Mastigocoleus sp. MO_188.B34]|uniref:IS1595 family transposase n=1 Tax=Mastigocoleus sp. MO_188.B34 TaxID=3036635 RepID=UPI00262F217A|nr:IS1595 family transposase [Mastigocoleus sp. MO_188.B34]MDJ0695642.1 IS1595 family transposase [Mastigocoleus sp. MO_188.B34]